MNYRNSSLYFKEKMLFQLKEILQSSNKLDVIISFVNILVQDVWLNLGEILWKKISLLRFQTLYLLKKNYFIT
jgi:hypothetical protein